MKILVVTGASTIAAVLILVFGWSLIMAKTTEKAAPMGEKAAISFIRYVEASPTSELEGEGRPAMLKIDVSYYDAGKRWIAHTDVETACGAARVEREAATMGQAIKDVIRSVGYVQDCGE